MAQNTLRKTYLGEYLLECMPTLINQSKNAQKPQYSGFMSNGYESVRVSSHLTNYEKYAILFTL